MCCRICATHFRGLSPRVRGTHALQRGLSPRVRGNPAAFLPSVHQRGSIPACAGEPRQLLDASEPAGVYPRVCGGTCARPGSWRSMNGLSPRVRGNLHLGLEAGGDVRSIPACAGEPAQPWYPVSCSKVYPRVCGGTFRHTRRENGHEGLSPRVRGNHRKSRSGGFGARSIPACAGEPRGWMIGDNYDGVYPRVCGGTRVIHTLVYVITGLSPRVRGNPSRGAFSRRGARSIPACAGEPESLWCRLTGSIPACAGEPLHQFWSTESNWVYPRVCGGTPLKRDDHAPDAGLSPRVRGNRP